MDGPSSIRKVLYPGRHDRPALRPDRVLHSGKFLNTPARNLLQGLQALAGSIHPEIFGTLETVRSLQPDGLVVATSKII